MKSVIVPFERFSKFEFWFQADLEPSYYIQRLMRIKATRWIAVCTIHWNLYRLLTFDSYSDETTTSFCNFGQIKASYCKAVKIYIKHKIALENLTTDRCRVVCTNVDQNLMADQRNFRAKYLQNGEENWTKK